jgi:hypothetical protein
LPCYFSGKEWEREKGDQYKERNEKEIENGKLDVNNHFRKRK